MSRSESPKPGLPSPAVRQRLQQVFEHGKKSFEKGDVDYAHDLFAQCVTEDPSNLVYLQHLRANLARQQEGGKKSSRFGGLNLKLKNARSTFAKAVAKGEWHEAFQAGCNALKQSPGHIATLLDLADACAQLGYADCRLYYLKWALDLEPQHEQANRQAAIALTEVGQFEQAIACWKRVQAIRPADHEVGNAINRLGVEATIQKGGYDQEMLRPGAKPSSLEDTTADGVTVDETLVEAQLARNEQLRTILEADPTNRQAYVELAQLYTEDNRLREAEELLRKALTVLGGGDLQLVEQLEDVQLRHLRRQLEVAQRRAETEGTTDAADLVQRMRIQANQQELEIYAARSQRSPQNPLLQFELGLRLKRAGKYREAIQALQAARSGNRRLCETQLHLGECFQRIEQYRLAMTSYEAAIAAEQDTDSPHLKLARYRAGVLATGLEEYDKAEKHLSELAAVDFSYRDVAARLDKLAQMRNT